MIPWSPAAEMISVVCKPKVAERTTHEKVISISPIADLITPISISMVLCFLGIGVVIFLPLIDFYFIFMKGRYLCMIQLIHSSRTCYTVWFFYYYYVVINFYMYSKHVCITEDSKFMGSILVKLWEKTIVYFRLFNYLFSKKMLFNYLENYSSKMPL